MSEHVSLSEIQKSWHGSYRDYIIGFIASLLLSAISFSLVAYGAMRGHDLAYALGALALAQAIFQLRYFLHVGHEESPQWESLVFYFMLLVLLILVLGSLWIMYDLDVRVMDNMAMEMAHD